MKKLIAWVAVTAAGLTCVPRAPAQEGPTVREVVIRHVGPPAAADSVIRANIRTAVGQPYSVKAVNDDVRGLFAKGWFTNIQIRREDVADGVRVIFVLQGKPKIRDIVIVGNKRLKTKKLFSTITMKVGQTLEGSKIEESVTKLVDVYQQYGYQQVKITHEEAVDPDTGQAVVTFHVEEGQRLFVQSVDFVGNKAIPTKLLRRQIRTKGHWMFSWLSRGNRLREEVFEEDKDRLRAFYQSRGYIDFEIKDVTVARVRPDRVTVRITVFEGQQYKVGDLKIEGNEKFPSSTLTPLLKMTTGKVFTPGDLDRDLQMLRDFYGSKGYIDLLVEPDRAPNVETGRMDLVYRLKEGDISYIEKIEIRGNTKTKDRVIRRELAVRPGQVFDMVKVRRSRERLQNLNYFDKVVAEPEPTEVENRKNLGVEVVEKRTGSVTFGAGASTVEQVFGFVEVSQGNFDLFNPPWFQGGGQKLRLRASVGTKSQYYLLSFVEPWFLDQRLALGFDLFRDQLNFISDVYALRQMGGDVHLSKAFGEFVTGQVKYELKQVEITDVSKNAAQFIKDEAGSSIKSSVTFTVRRDTRDNLYIPTRGNWTELTAQFAGGPLGGSTDIYKLEARSSFFFPLWRKHVLEIKLATGVVDAYGSSDTVPLFERFKLGGPTTLRGFKYNDVGPKWGDNPGEVAPGIGNPVGGDTYATATAEYTIPIITLPRAGVRLAGFYDVGNVWAKAYDFRIGHLNDDVGVGLRIDVLNIPIRFDYAIPIQHDKFNDSGGRFNFSLGYQF